MTLETSLTLFSEGGFAFIIWLLYLFSCFQDREMNPFHYISEADNM